MKVNLKELELEVISENEKIEELAFKMFCKAKIAERLKQIKEDEERLSKSKKRMEDLTEENLKSWFNTQDVCRDTKNSAKYYEAAKKQLNL